MSNSKNDLNNGANDAGQQAAEFEDFVSLNQQHVFENVGSSVTGKLLAFLENAAAKSDPKALPGIFLLLNESGIVRITWTTQLDMLRQLPAGTSVKLTFTGQVKTGNGYNVRTFNIQVSRKDFHLIEAAFLNPSPGNLLRTIKQHIEEAEEIPALPAGSDTDPFKDDDNFASDPRYNQEG